MGELFQPGRLLRDGRFEIQKHLRSPNGKDIYLARDRVVGRKVVVDIFSNTVIMPSGISVSAWEAQVLDRLGDHPNIATVLDHWEDDEMAAMVTRYLKGGSLHDLIDRSMKESGNGLPMEDVFRLSIELSYGLAYIHSCEILYRDLQPRNVLFDEWGTLHLVDFDTAVQLGDQEMSDISQRAVINYMAPELTDGFVADQRADLYSLGATMFEMIMGRQAFPGTREVVLASRQTGRIPSPRRVGLPEGLKHLVLRLLAPEPTRRPTRADEVAGYLEQLRANHAQIEAAAKKRRRSGRPQVPGGVSRCREHCGR